jgi:hypothetical protein
MAAIDPGHAALAEELDKAIATAEHRPDLRQVSLRRTIAADASIADREVPRAVTRRSAS